MAASVTKRYMISVGNHKQELIFIDANDATSLASVGTLISEPWGCNLFEVSHTDGVTNDSMTKAGTPLVVFSGTSVSTRRILNCSGMTATKHYILKVTGF